MFTYLLPKTPHGFLRAESLGAARTQYNFPKTANTRGTFVPRTPHRFGRAENGLWRSAVPMQTVGTLHGPCGWQAVAM